jgi:transcription antitermination factor NusG
MYLLSVMTGKENLVRTILRKNGFPSQPAHLRGYLLSDLMPSHYLLDEISYIFGVTEVSEEKAKRFLENPEEAKTELCPGATVEVVSGIYQDFKGIVREVSDGSLKVDLGVFGKVVPVELQPSEVRVVIACASWV